MNKRYASKLLFQYRVEIDGVSNKIRTVEERIIVINATDAQSAWAMASEIGENDETSFENNDGNLVFIEYIGILDLLNLGLECDETTVWYEIKEKLTPMERKKMLIPAKESLSAFNFDG